MPAKTISLSIEAYERLKAHKRKMEESFSQVVMRASWPEDTITASELMVLWENAPPFYTDVELDYMDNMKVAEPPPEDKWNPR